MSNILKKKILVKKGKMPLKILNKISQIYNITFEKKNSHLSLKIKNNLYKKNL